MSNEAEKRYESLWRQLYGPSQEEVWGLLSAEIKGTLKPGWLSGMKVEVEHGPWIITLDSYSERLQNGRRLEFTRMRAPFVNPNGFRFAITNSDAFKEFFKKLGFQSDYKTGIEDFDRKYIIESNSDALIEQLLASSAVRDQIDAQPKVRLTVQDNDGLFGKKFPQNVDELHFEVVGVIKDLPRLRLLFDLFCRTLERLCDMGVVPPEDPVVRL